ncbi:type VI immunity family protein [Rhodovulum sp. DZ06]|uniref:type VI immunity family protein n=1 Tax=Rhodovulum sp. DZ06 TaxID=3425126 RepID=UPI003D3450CC
MTDENGRGADMELSALDALKIETGGGEPPLRIGLEIALDMAPGRDPAQTGALAQAVDRFVARFGAGLAWGDPSEGGRPVPLTDAVKTGLGDWIRGGDPSSPQVLHLFGGEAGLPPHPLHLRLFRDADWMPDGACRLILGIPVSALEALPPGAFLEEVCTLTADLSPISGGAGLALLADPQTYGLAEVQPVLIAALRRFPGLDFNPSVLHGLTGGVKRVNWLTVLTAEEAAQLPAALPAPLVLHRCGAGGVLQAGPAPQLGDAEAGLRPEPYHVAGKLLAPMRDQGIKSVFRAISGGDAAALSQEWLAAFD